MRRYLYITAGLLSLSVVVLMNSAERNNYYLNIREVRATTPDSVYLMANPLVAPILYQEVQGLEQLAPEEAKKTFISALLPPILLVKYRIAMDRQRIRSLFQKDIWSLEDSLFFEQQGDFYKTFDRRLLQRRMRTHPNSIILAQAAVESGWGSSRFFIEANNVFGIWSYRTDEPRIRASYSRSGAPVYLRQYPDISASVHDYFGVVARARAYRHFRQARDTTDDIKVLLPLLKYYSERREAYVDQLETIIRQNNLTQYDDYQLDPSFFVEENIFSLFGYDLDTTVSFATAIPDLSEVQFVSRPFPIP